MAKIIIQGNASGDGILTIQAPNTDVDRTVTIPDASGTLLNAGSTLDATKLSGDLPAISGANLTGITHTPADNSVTLAKMAHGTDGELITYDAAGAPANVAVGTSGHILTSGGAGVAPTFQAAAGGGLYASVAIIADQKTSGTGSGTFTLGAWRTRDLNTEISDTDGIVSISSNQFTLQAGTYTLGWNAPAYRVAVNKSGLYNVTDSSFTALGQSNYCYPAYVIQNYSTGETVFTISGAKTYEIRHYNNTSASNGFGAGTGAGDGEIETYLIVKILKHS